MRVDYQAPLDLQPGQTITLSTELTVPSPYVFGHDILDHLAARLLLAAGADPIDKIFLIHLSLYMSYLGLMTYLSMYYSRETTSDEACANAY